MMICTSGHQPSSFTWPAIHQALAEPSLLYLIFINNNYPIFHIGKNYINISIGIKRRNRHWQHNVTTANFHSRWSTNYNQVNITHQHSIYRPAMHECYGIRISGAISNLFNCSNKKSPIFHISKNHINIIMYIKKRLGIQSMWYKQQNFTHNMSFLTPTFLFIYPEMHQAFAEPSQLYL